MYLRVPIMSSPVQLIPHHLLWVIQTVFQLILTLKIVTTAPATSSSLTSIFCHTKHQALCVTEDTLPCSSYF